MTFETVVRIERRGTTIRGWVDRRVVVVRPAYGMRRTTREAIANRRKSRERPFMVEPLLSGIVLGLVPVTISGLLVTAYLQYRRGDSLSF